LFLTLSLFAASQTSEPPDSFVARGRACLEQGDFSGARAFFEKALESKPARPEVEYEVVWNLGLLAWNNDRIEESRSLFQHAGEIAASTGRGKEAADCRAAERIRISYLLGVDARNRGDRENADRHFREAEILADQIHSPAHSLKILRAWSHAHLGDMADLEFLALNERALKAARVFHHRDEIFESLIYIGIHYSAKNEYSLALRRYFEALSEARLRANDRDLVTVLNNIAAIYSVMGSQPRSAEYYTEALRIALRKPESMLAATILGDLGDVNRLAYRETGDLDKAGQALDRYRESLEMLARTKSPELLKDDTRAKIGSLLVDLGRFGDGRRYLELALASAEKAADGKRSVAFSNEMGLALEKGGDTAKAVIYLGRALDAADEKNYFPEVAKAHFGLALCDEKTGDLAGAVFHYNESLDIVGRLATNIQEDLYRAEYAFAWEKVPERLVDLYFRLAEKSPSAALTHEIFRVVEIAKSRSFFGRFSAKEMSCADTAGAFGTLDRRAVNETRNDALRALASGRLTPEERQRREFELRRVEDTIYTAAKTAVAGGRVETAPVTVEAVQKELLDRRTALIEYWLGPERSIGLILTDANYGIVELPSAQRIEDSLDAYLGFLAGPEIAPAKAVPGAERLYRELFAPVEAALPPSITRLIIVPDGILNDLPFETLRIPQPGQRIPDYLMERFTVSYAPSATSLLYLSRRPQPPIYASDLLAVGASDYPRPEISDDTLPPAPSRILAAIYAEEGYDLSPLPGARREVTRAATHFRKDRRRIIVGKNATESAFMAALAGDHRIVHIASHALSDEIDPLRSALVFSPEERSDEDGFVQVRELEAMRFSADLIILSGCRTSRGRRLGHEGVIGLPRALFYAGARSVVSSLWKVEDRATAAFMDAFYDAMARTESKAEALRTAKLRMAASRFSHPCFWAAFVLAGAE
jgi:CHAT domain-containing protein/tetratricopeptide (TPR) repeat protein